MVTIVKLAMLRALLMQLEDYLRSRDESRAAFGRRIGCDVSNISNYCAGKRIPGREIMTLIADATEGLVTPNDFFPEAMAAVAKHRGSSLATAAE